MRIRAAPILAVVGRKNSGKTRIVEYLVSNLAATGIRIAVLKHVHHPDFTLDTPGKDSWKHARAGARVVVIVGKNEIAVIKKVDTSNYDMDELLSTLKEENLDLICLEGFHSLIARDESVFKIVTARNQSELEDTLRGTAPPILAISGLVSKEGLKSKSGLPIINLELEGEKLVKLIKNRVLK